MGEMADFVNDKDPFDCYDERLDEFPKLPLTHTCKYCGRTGLYWSQDLMTGKWRLIEGHEVHTCKKYRKATTTSHKGENK